MSCLAMKIVKAYSVITSIFSIQQIFYKNKTDHIIGTSIEYQTQFNDHRITFFNDPAYYSCFHSPKDKFQEMTISKNIVTNSYLINDPSLHFGSQSYLNLSIPSSILSSLNSPSPSQTPVNVNVNKPQSRQTSVSTSQASLNVNKPLVVMTMPANNNNNNKIIPMSKTVESVSDPNKHNLISQVKPKTTPKLFLITPSTVPKPTVTHAKPVAGHAKPVATHAKPVAGHAKPVAGHAKPVATHAKPVATHAKPVATHAKPVAGHAKPVAGNAKPVAGHAKPVAGHAKPIAGHAKPVAGHAKPVATHAKPVAGHAKPVAGHAKPVATHAKPVATHAKPVYGHAKPVATHAKPVAGHAKPVSGHAKPVVTHAKPIATHAKPVATHAKPVGNHGKPVATHAKPVGNHGKPVVTHSRPVANHGKPVATHAKPVGNHGKPVATHAKPVGNHGKPNPSFHLSSFEKCKKDHADYYKLNWFSQIFHANPCVREKFEIVNVNITNTYQKCIVNRELWPSRRFAIPSALTTGHHTLLQQCSHVCYTNRYRYIGLVDERSCLCSQKQPSHKIMIHSNLCKKCKDDISKRCGNHKYGFLSVYQIV